MASEGAPRVLLAASGSVAATGLPNWAVLMRASWDWQVRVCLSPAAAEFVTARAIAATTGSAPVGPHWSDVPLDFTFQEVAEWADVVVVIPATASTIGKLAHGLCDNLMVTVVCAAAVPVVVVPAIPAAMWDRPAVQRNLAVLTEDGYDVLAPEQSLSLRSGRIEHGMPNIMTVVERVRSHLDRRVHPTPPAPG